MAPSTLTTPTPTPTPTPSPTPSPTPTPTPNRMPTPTATAPTNGGLAPVLGAAPGSFEHAAGYRRPGSSGARFIRAYSTTFVVIFSYVWLAGCYGVPSSTAAAVIRGYSATLAAIYI